METFPKVDYWGCCSTLIAPPLHRQEEQGIGTLHSLWVAWQLRRHRLSSSDMELIPASWGARRDDRCGQVPMTKGFSNIAPAPAATWCMNLLHGAVQAWAFSRQFKSHALKLSTNNLCTQKVSNLYRTYRISYGMDIQNVSTLPPVLCSLHGIVCIVFNSSWIPWIEHLIRVMK